MTFKNEIEEGTIEEDENFSLTGNNLQNTEISILETDLINNRELEIEFYIKNIENNTGKTLFCLAQDNNEMYIRVLINSDQKLEIQNQTIENFNHLHCKLQTNIMSEPIPDKHR